MTDIEFLLSDAARTSAPPAEDPETDMVTRKISDNAVRGKASSTTIPPWEYAPDMPRNELGWFLGYAADYLLQFSKWYKALPETEQAAFTWKYPEPEGWKGFYDSLTDGE